MGNIKKVEIYSDGGARPNPGPGGYGTILRFGKKEKELSGFEEHTTNNRMELTGAIKGLEELKEPCEVEMFTDSSYVVNGIEKGWAEKWKANNWMRTKSEKAINYDLWEQLLDLVEKHKIHFNWVRGHSGHIENERCDELATNEILKRNLSPLTPTSTSPLTPLLRGEGDNVGMRENYKNFVPEYVKELSKKLRKNGTKVEEILWEILRNRKLNGIKFRRQHPFGRYIVDFYSDELKLVIELDGKIHDNKQDYDKIRDELISQYGVKILRIKNDDIYNNLENTINKILEYKTPSPLRRGLGGGGSGWLGGDQKNIKITKINQPCRKCGTPVIKATPKKKNTKNKSFYYKWFLSCPNCKTNYFVEEGKVML